MRLFNQMVKSMKSAHMYEELEFLHKVQIKSVNVGHIWGLKNTFWLQKQQEY